jgi:hypothetical protein
LLYVRQYVRFRAVLILLGILSMYHILKAEKRYTICGIRLSKARVNYRSFAIKSGNGVFDYGCTQEKYKKLWGIFQRLKTTPFLSRHAWCSSRFYSVWLNESGLLKRWVLRVCALFKDHEYLRDCTCILRAWSFQELGVNFQWF